MSKKVTFSSLKKYEENPFIIELEGKMYIQPRANTIIAKGQAIVDTETGEEISESVLIGRRKYVDKSQFAKLYASEIGILYELTKTAQNVFLHLSKIMDYDNKAIFDYTQHYKKLGWKTKDPALRGLKELLERGIIAAHSVSHIYWLNPRIICKGERFAKYTEYIVKSDSTKSVNDIKTTESRALTEGMPEKVSAKVDAANATLETSKNNSLFDSQGKNPYKQNTIFEHPDYDKEKE